MPWKKGGPQPKNGFDFFSQTIFISLTHHSPSYLALFPFRRWVPWGKDWVCAQPLPSAHQHGPRSLLKVSRHYHKLSENQDWQEMATGHKGPNQLLSVPLVNVCSFTLFLHFLCLSSWQRDATRDATRAATGGYELMQASWETTCSPGHVWISAFVLHWTCLQNLARRSSCRQHALQRVFTCSLTIIIGRNTSP